MNQRGLIPALGRLITIVTVPIWLPALLILWFLAESFIALPYWLWTGEEL